MLCLFHCKIKFFIKCAKKLNFTNNNYFITMTTHITMAHKHTNKTNYCNANNCNNIIDEDTVEDTKWHTKSIFFCDSKENILNSAFSFLCPACVLFSQYSLFSENGKCMDICDFSMICMLNLFSNGIGTTVLITHIRNSLQRKYNIEHNFCDDLIEILFCPICIIAQHEREIIYRQNVNSTRINPRNIC